MPREQVGVIFPFFPPHFGYRLIISLRGYASFRFIVREFKYDELALEKQKKEMEDAALEEKELWVSDNGDANILN